MWRKGILVQFWQECKSVQPLWKIVWCYLKTNKQTNKQDRTTLYSSSSTSQNLPEENINNDLRMYMHPYFIKGLFATAKTWKQPKCASNR